MRALMLLLMTAFLAFPAMAAWQGPGSAAPATTVSKVGDMPDDAIVSLTGNIVEKITGKKDKYTFRDDTGTITVEIDDKYFNGQDVTPDTKVQIIGEVDKDFGKPVEIDVKKLEIVK